MRMCVFKTNARSNSNVRMGPTHDPNSQVIRNDFIIQNELFNKITAAACLTQSIRDLFVQPFLRLHRFDLWSCGIPFGNGRAHSVYLFQRSKPDSFFV